MSRGAHARSRKASRRATGRSAPRRPSARATGIRGGAGSTAKKTADRRKPGDAKKTADRRKPGDAKRLGLPLRRRPKTSAARAGRRNRVPVVLAGLVAFVILLVGFPASALWSQHQQLAAASAQLTELQHQNRVLAEQQHQLSSNAEIARLAREDYQLIPKGQTLFNILPPAGHTSSTGSGTMTGDPGSQPLVAPSNAPSMSPDPGLPPTVTATPPQRGSAATSGTSSGPSTFWSRVSDTLEFWK